MMLDPMYRSLEPVISSLQPEARPTHLDKLFTEGDALYEAMLASIDSATTVVRMESYIFASDEIGWRFARALASSAAAGVDVRVHLDAAGAWGSTSSSLQRFLRSHGVHLRWFHRWSWREPLRYNRRSHRKLLVVDDRVAYIGGFNIHRESSRQCYGESRWRDTHAEVSGPLAGDAARLFDAFWRGHRRWTPVQRGVGDLQLVSNHTRACRHRIRCLYAEAFESASEHVYLTTPYFVPDLSTLRQLMACARRGVDVRLLVPAKSDVPITRWAAHAFYASLLSAGVRIYEYLPRMLHAKTVVVDRRWATLGSANLDYRSFFLNYELLLAMTAPGDCEALVRQFCEDASTSRRILGDRWSGRSWTNLPLEAIGRVLRRWL
ncbi:MAG: phospholipase D-like domain-containing protein [Caldimonas sp.]